jgi:hypothetical protein
VLVKHCLRPVADLPEHPLLRQRLLPQHGQDEVALLRPAQLLLVRRAELLDGLLDGGGKHRCCDCCAKDIDCGSACSNCGYGNWRACICKVSRISAIPHLRS